MTTATRTRTTAGRARTRTAGRTRTTPQRTAQRGRGTAAQRGRTTAAQKAYARRAQRSAAVEHGGSGAASAGVLSLVKLRMPRSRASFVLVMMSLLATGVVLTLWLSTQAIADSYRLEAVRAQTATLTERAEKLQREVARQQTTAALDDKARALGMVPSGHPARILVTDTGKRKVIGEAKPAQPVRQPAARPIQRRPAEQREQREEHEERRPADRTERGERQQDERPAGER